MECKGQYVSVTSVSSSDLIDTLWNVKRVHIIILVILKKGFNRYIVECKDSCDLATILQTFGFNRYIVECKVDSERAVGLSNVRFNRYIVECKGLSTFPVPSFLSPI